MIETNHIIMKPGGWTAENIGTQIMKFCAEIEAQHPGVDGEYPFEICPWSHRLKWFITPPYQPADDPTPCHGVIGYRLEWPDSQEAETAQRAKQPQGATA